MFTFLENQFIQWMDGSGTNADAERRRWSSSGSEKWKKKHNEQANSIEKCRTRQFSNKTWYFSPVKIMIMTNLNARNNDKFNECRCVHVLNLLIIINNAL